jgi:hypothetical protein
MQSLHYPDIAEMTPDLWNLTLSKLWNPVTRKKIRHILRHDVFISLHAPVFFNEHEK